MTINSLQEKIFITLGPDATFPQKVVNFTKHSEYFNEILPDLLKESNQKQAGRHLKATFLRTESLSDYDPMLR